MYAVEFKARVADGMIRIPEPYQEQIKDVVRVIVLVETPSADETFIDQLLAQPLQLPDFQPLRREDIYARS